MSSPLCILIIDPDAASRDFLNERLRQAGHEVALAASGKEALAACKKRPHALVLLALTSPADSELFSKLKRLAPDCQVIVIGEERTPATAIEALRAGASDYLLKPFASWEAIAGTIERVIEKIQLSQENRVLVERLRKHGEELEEVNRVLQELAVRDGLTGLYNHRYFYEAIDIEHARARRHDGQYSILFIDLDHFKRFNEQYGHPHGDELLREIAAIFQARLRQSDIAARYGGEEFGLILPETARRGAEVVAENLRLYIADNQFTETVPGSGKITVSIGLASYPDDGDAPKQLIQAADRALHRAKNAGRNCVKGLSHGRTAGEQGK